MKENVLGVDGGDGCMAKWMYLMPLSCTLKNDWNGGDCFVMS